MGLSEWGHQFAILSHGLVALMLTVMALGPLIQSSGDVVFSAQAILAVTGLLGAVSGALVAMFRSYQAAVDERIADLQGQILARDRDIEYWRGIGEQSTRLAETTTAAFRGRTESNRPPERGAPRA